MSKLKSPILMVFIAAICFSFPAVLTKLLVDTIAPIAILFLRYLFVVITFPLIIVIIRKSTFKELFLISKTELKHFFFLSLFLTGDTVLFFQSLYFISVSKILFLFLTYPIMTLVLARIFLKENISLTDITATIISLLGIVIMFWQNLNLQGFKGEIMVLSAALLWSAYIILNRYSGQTKNHYRKTYWLFLISSIMILFVVLIFKETIPVYSLNLNQTLLIVLLAILTLIPFTLLSYALKHVKSSTSSIILLLGPVFGILLSFVVLKEKLPLNILLGGFLILTSAFISTYSIEKIFQTSKLFSNKIKTILFGY
ncbi:MAG: DMT family transporter [Candidatus Woesearchaeota archaeon]|nr:DMT family transporter [Candidatus Woesearchaeota archaeon]MDP6265857.1 DMT family transporter [Candidatus Woesearchaeota archaeon]MDP7322462.1 DMT family transporter [Candidatus Woesearchaeota archaeon]MDP7476285.1 DMT family transporter [Candidatus Woesearchaeota archaeon]HJO01943.1 DMT family transporter [Candidatus Woesearchaeota archaeon]